jgi:hypothetical protein
LAGEVWFRYVPYNDIPIEDREGGTRKARLTHFGSYNRVEAEKALAADEAYVTDVTEQMIAGVRAGRQVLVFGGLIEHLATYRARLRSQGIDPPGARCGRTPS